MFVTNLPIFEHLCHPIFEHISTKKAAEVAILDFQNVIQFSRSQSAGGTLVFFLKRRMSYGVVVCHSEEKVTKYHIDIGLNLEILMSSVL